ncbi:unnamed protein product [Calypogeia fissa]
MVFLQICSEDYSRKEDIMHCSQIMRRWSPFSTSSECLWHRSSASKCGKSGKIRVNGLGYRRLDISDYILLT